MRVEMFAPPLLRPQLPMPGSGSRAASRISPTHSSASTFWYDPVCVGGGGECKGRKVRMNVLKTDKHVRTYH
jgi:hypothetical protein